MIDPLSPLGIAETIFSQMGGKRQLTQMVGAKNFVYESKSENETVASFKFQGSKKVNYCSVTYRRCPDVYDLRFFKLTSPTSRNNWEGGRKLTSEHLGVYCDQLMDLFESSTDLFLTLHARN